MVLGAVGSGLESTGIGLPIGELFNVAATGLAFGSTAYGQKEGLLSKTQAGVQYGMDSLMLLGSLGSAVGKARMAARAAEGSDIAANAGIEKSAAVAAESNLSKLEVDEERPTDAQKEIRQAEVSQYRRQILEKLTSDSSISEKLTPDSLISQKLTPYSPISQGEPRVAVRFSEFRTVEDRGQVEGQIEPLISRGRREGELIVGKRRVIASNGAPYRINANEFGNASNKWDQLNKIIDNQRLVEITTSWKESMLQKVQNIITESSEIQKYGEELAYYANRNRKDLHWDRRGRTTLYFLRKYRHLQQNESITYNKKFLVD